MRIEKPKQIKTPWGTAKIDNKGYYVITSGKEGNNGKFLHRLIYEANFDPIPDGYEIHHRNGDKTDNCIYNLRCLSKSEHRKLHTEGENHPMFGKTHSDETRRKMSESQKGKTLSDEHKQKISESISGENHYMFGKHHSEETKQKLSESKNTTSYFHVSKQKNKRYKQGFIWIYTFYEDGKYKRISSVSLQKLEEKVRAAGLTWKKIDKKEKESE